MVAATRAHAGVFRLSTLLLALVLSLIVLEFGLRVAGFRYELRVTVLDSTAPDVDRAHRVYRIDRDLIWVPRDYDDRLRRAREASLLFLGDSCTEFGGYPRAFARTVERRTGRTPTIANLAVAGWTSHQGLRQIERDLGGLSPRVVALYYGWNDHWASIGLDDRQIERVNRSALFGLQSLRIGQLVTRGWIGFRARGAQPPPRVALDDFRDNLTLAVERIRSLGATPVLITAPSSHEPGREPAYLGERWMPDLDQLVPTHRRYADVVREVARSLDAPLVDLALEFDALPAGRRSAAFMQDGIHFSADGDLQAARMLYDGLERHGLIGSVAP